MLGSGDNLAAVGIETRLTEAAKRDDIRSAMSGSLPDSQFVQNAPRADVRFPQGGQGLGRACFAIQAVERTNPCAEQVKAQRQTEAARSNRAENIL